MCKAWEEIKLEGREEGIKEGKLEILFELVKEKIIDAAEAASRVSMSEKEFKESMKKAGY